MIGTRRTVVPVIAVLAATALQGCAGFNPLLLIDDPFVSPRTRAAEEQKSPADTAWPQAAPVDSQAAAPLSRAVPMATVSTPPTAEISEVMREADSTDFASAFDFVMQDEPAAQPVASMPAGVASRERSAPIAATPPRSSTDLAREAAELGMSVVGSMPEQSGAALAQAPAADAYAPFTRFALARLEGLQPGGMRSMLLLDPPSLDPELQRCGNKPPAVLIDLDPGAGLMPLVGSDGSDPALTGHLAMLRDRGVTVYWISGHGPEAAGRIRTILQAAALDPTGEDPLIVTRFAGESKQARRYALGDTHCLLAIAGDQRGDFDELYDFVLDPVMAAPLEELVGDGWFIAPPPVG